MEYALLSATPRKARHRWHLPRSRIKSLKNRLQSAPVHGLFEQHWALAHRMAENGQT
jgi:hypothetical protein